MTRLLTAHPCPGLFYATPAQDGYLLRLRTPGGRLRSAQALGLAAWAQTWGCDSLQVTNRANLQLRVAQAPPTLESIGPLQTLGLASPTPAMDRLRNIMASPTAGLDTQEGLDPSPWVQALDRHLQTHPELAGLPSKMSVGFDGGGRVGLGTRSPVPWEHRPNEIQLTAVATPTGSAFHLTLGPPSASPAPGLLLAPDQVLATLAALLAVYAEGLQTLPNLPEKARLKHLLQVWGLEGYLQRVGDRLATRQLPRSEPLPYPPSQPYAHLGIHPQRQTGRVYLGLPLPLGQITRAQLKGLARLAQTRGRGEVRLTPWQGILLPDVPEAELPQLLPELAALGLPVGPDWTTAGIVACAGQPGCRAAATDTQALARTLHQTLHHQFALDIPVNIHITACPKGCAQPSPAEILLLGTRQLVGGDLQEAYYLYGGQAAGEPQLLHPEPLAVPELLPTLTRLLQHYGDQRATPQESLSAFVRRYPWEALAQAALPVCP